MLTTRAQQTAHTYEIGTVVRHGYTRRHQWSTDTKVRHAPCACREALSEVATDGDAHHLSGRAGSASVDKLSLNERVVSLVAPGIDYVSKVACLNGRERVTRAVVDRNVFRFDMGSKLTGDGQ